MKRNIMEKEFNFCPTCGCKLVRKLIDRRNLLACPKCSFVFWNNPKPTVSTIIEKDKKILLLKRNKKPLENYWVLPGGYIDYEEKPEDAAIRETKEETNLNVKICRLIGVYQIDNDPRGINLDIIYYALDKKTSEIRVNDESNNFEYFSLDKLPKLIAYKHRQAIKDFVKQKK